VFNHLEFCVTFGLIVDLGSLTCDDPWHLIELLELTINLLTMIC
jgi:hypothetical protein